MKKKGMKVLLRCVQEVPFDKWMEHIEMEERCDEVLGEFGFGRPRRYRALFGEENSNVRVSQTIYDSFGELGALTQKWLANGSLQRLEAERHRTFSRERRELFFVDSGSRVPLWMQLTSKTPIRQEYLENCANDNLLVPESPEMCIRDRC